VGTRSRREAIQGVPEHARLAPVYDANAGEVTVPTAGLLLSTKLAELLGVGQGESVRVEVLEGRRPVLDVPVAGLFETTIGTPAVMSIDALDRALRERPMASAAHLLVDPARAPELFRALKELPAVSAVTLRRAAVQKFNETMAESILIFIGFFATFSCTLAFGVAYNATRVALSERARELATLRVLGHTRLEISYILLGEVALLALLGLPVGCLVGVGIVRLMAEQFETELYRVPLVLDDATFGWSVSIALTAIAVSAAIVRRRLDRLDLVAVLKTRE
jgi:putative ABC transport system permease protein